MRLSKFTIRGMTKFIAMFALILATMIAVERRKQSFLRRANEFGVRFFPCNFSAPCAHLVQ